MSDDDVKDLGGMKPDIDPLPEIQQIAAGIERILAQVKALKEEIG